MLALLLGGCSTVNSMTEWVVGADDDLDEEISTYVEPTPGAPTGLQRAWSHGVVGSPDKYMPQPRHFEESGGALFISGFQGDVTRVDAATGRSSWDVDLDTPIFGGVTTDGARVYVGDADGHAIALDAATGAEVWRERLSTKISSAPMVQGELVFFQTLDNRIYALNAATGKRVWFHGGSPSPLSMMGAASPTAFSHGILAGYSTGDVHAFEPQTGKDVWDRNLTVIGGRTELDLLQDVDADPVVSGLRIYVVSHQGRLMAIYAPNGAQVWQSRLSALRTPLLDGARLYVADVEGYLHALSAEDGTPLWKTRLSDGMLTAPTRFKDQIIVADDSGRRFAVDPASGRVLGMDKSGESYQADPLIAAGGLYLLTRDGDLERFE
ncbi:putative pyrrolo-quinoline quinone [Magnetofaba australis IT-1]|uniref:Putative pyrrolo-quinoline quinone n=1 Tax=Magnetofaba australis IT-1 TaxID=1434232 RepID=A0A1Y2K7I7_9PROT|nr:putative pyrrolo-quinoline quinone [Magnetofaba australis IT-1]